MTAPTRPGPLAGVRVLDFSRLMPFSYGTQLLVDAGATVVKVETPGGEYGRGMTEAFAMTNRGKRSITLDLRAPSAVAIVVSLLKSFDVVFESFRPSFMDSLGLGYEALSQVKPGLVYCSATGYGQTGPYAGRAGHDINYAALGGLLQLGHAAPQVPAVPFIDMAIGWAAAFGIAAGVLDARSTGRGRHVDASMAEMALSLNLLAVAESAAENVSGVGAGGDGPLDDYPWPALMLQECPCYGVFRTLDDRYIALGNIEPKFWRAFLSIIERPALEPYRFSTGAEGARARAEIVEVISARTRADWESVLSAADVCYAPVNSPRSAVEDQHYRARGAVQQAAGGPPAINSPVSFSSPADRGPSHTAVPQPGEANEEILGGAGASAADIQKWRDAGVI